jgi:hypothetical protein
MNFIEAVALLNKDEHISMKRNNGYFEVKSSAGHLSVSGELYSPMCKDIIAEDWYVVKDEKLHTFEEALKALKEGATVHRYNEKFVHSLDSKHSFAFLVKADILADDWIIIDKEKTK